jgi:flagellar protein FlgJ
MDISPSTPAVTASPAVDFQALASQARSRDPRAIEQAAVGFESIFVSQLLKEMRQTLEPGTLFGEDGGDVYGGMFDLHLAQHLARGGVLGIADMVRRQLSQGGRS